MKNPASAGSNPMASDPTRYLVPTSEPYVFPGNRGQVHAPGPLGQIEIPTTARVGDLWPISFDACDDDALGSTPGNLILTVPSPSVFQLLQSPTVTPADNARLDAYWRPFGQVFGTVADLGFNPGAGRRLPFLGPYAYLPRAGTYELVAAAGITGGGALRLDAQVETGVAPEAWQALVTGPGAHYVDSANVVLAAGVAQRLAFNDMFMCYRHIMFTVTGANRVLITIGTAVHNCDVNETLEIPAQLLGRNTVEISAAAGSTIAVTLSLWA